MSRIDRPPCLAGALAMVLLGGPARAQDSPSSSTPSDKPSTTASKLAKVAAVFKKPLHPVIGTVATGGGLGVGVAYRFPTRGDWNASSRTIVTPRLYWSAQIDGGHTGRRAEWKGYARARRMNRLNYFGPGPDSSEDSWTSFSLRDPVVGVVGSVDVVPAVQLGGRIEEMWPEVSAGRNPDTISIEQRFAEPAAPGLVNQPRFTRYQAFAQATAPAGAGRAFNQGGAYRISYDLYEDASFDLFGFHRVELEGRHTFAIGRPYQSVTLHGWISSAEPRSGEHIPFYLQHTLGGISALRSVDESLLGTDGSAAATLRGYPNLRFRDDHLLLLQAEYRWDVWRLIDATVFVDAGKTVSRRADLDLSGLKTDFGFSLSAMRANTTVARVDVGFSPEGPRVFFSFGGLLQ